MWVISKAHVCASAAARERLLACAKAHLEAFEAHKKLWLSARALSLSQRMLLYAKDELEMCTLRLHLRAPGERVKPQEALYKLHPAEVPVRNVVRPIKARTKPVSDVVSPSKRGASPRRRCTSCTPRTK